MHTHGMRNSGAQRNEKTHSQAHSPLKKDNLGNILPPHAIGEPIMDSSQVQYMYQFKSENKDSPEKVIVRVMPSPRNFMQPHLSRSSGALSKS